MGHLFVVDIEFDKKKNATEKQLFFNEIYTSISEKKKFFSANERSVFQLLEARKFIQNNCKNSSNNG